MAAREHVETERKYDVDGTTAVPLGEGDATPGVGAVIQIQLDAVYFDTPALDLHRRGITLRRRTGGDDEGWHVKVPRGRDEKTELRHPLGRAVRSVPRQVADPVRAIVRDRPLVPVAAIATDRTAYTLLSAARPLATLCDDRVCARLLNGEDDHGEQAWREWELEAVEGQPASVFRSIEPLLLGSGARPADHASKLDRILATHAGDREPKEPTCGPKGSLAALLRDRLVQQISALHEQDAAVRAGSPEGVHRLRIAARRLRSALTTAKPLFEQAPEDLLGELRWLGQVLSPARDTQVIRERLEAALSAEPRELVLGPARRRLRIELAHEHKDALARAREALGSTRYYRLLDALDALVADLPLAPAARAPARLVLGDLVRRDAMRLHRAARAVAESDAAGHDPALHEARKKAKRLRYAAELAVPAGGRRAKRLAKRAKAVQQALGQHQDTVVARQRLRQLGAQSFLRGENGFTFGLLHGVERLRAEHAELEFQSAWVRMPRPRTAAAWVSKR
ncbi:CHAD domain-containing protein [Phycicoccus badiiscoriae]|uniref:CHAD domain-containing protein n=1 Tax=Pedococcus badiiscoriae TaxID=642776 RepID=A0A852WE31_9MICO|nr:CYTH and CHAD domain-containing protein [Pedococcus badiiscoriae]NYG07288.1 CHAD domain-containing protein [Pedococcus badiiscoriae]